ncbi:MAG: sugar transferase [Phycisphaerae bacterium]
MTEMQQNRSRTIWARGPKRVVECALAVLLIVLLLPITIPAALLIKIASPGPLFFTQIRTGLNGHPFKIIKFRTMRAGRKPDPKELVPLDHAEITAVGRWLRRFKIDELPQLLNVVVGQMSLIGPRPTLSTQTDAYDAFRAQRLWVRPGITGLAQVCGNTAIPWAERILFDIAYVRRCSLLLDLWILIQTLAVIVRGECRNPKPFAESRFAADVPIPNDYFHGPGRIGSG